MKAHRAYLAAAAGPIGHTVAWHNPNTGNRGSFTPLRDGTSTYGRYCREFQQQVIIAGRREVAYGTACRQADGSWQMKRG